MSIASNISINPAIKGVPKICSVTFLEKSPDPSPKMRAKQALAQTSSLFWEVPTEVYPLIMAHSGEAVFRLGATCKDWNAEVQNFLIARPEGRAVFRQTCEKSFRHLHQMSVINVLRQSRSESYFVVSYYDDSFLGKQERQQLRSADALSHVVVPDKGDWMSLDLQDAIATRSRKLTVFEVDAPDADSMRAVTRGLKAVPSNGFAALKISENTLDSPDASKLWEAICAHPVVVHIQCEGNDRPGVGDKIVELIDLLSKNQANVTSLTLTRCRLELQSGETLAKLLKTEAGIQELEIHETETNAENLKRLSEAVRSRNTLSASPVAVYFSADNLDMALEADERKEMATNGISFREPNQPWIIQEDAVNEAPVNEDSSEADSSEVVGDPSSEDVTSDSEFDSSAEDSDPIVGGSSDDEG